MASIATWCQTRTFNNRNLKVSPIIRVVLAVVMVLTAAVAVAVAAKAMVVGGSLISNVKCAEIWPHCISLS